MALGSASSTLRPLATVPALPLPHPSPRTAARTRRSTRTSLPASAPRSDLQAPAERRLPGGDHAPEDRPDNLLLVPEVVVEVARANTSLPRNVVGRYRRRPTLVEQPRCCLHYPLPRAHQPPS